MSEREREALDPEALRWLATRCEHWMTEVPAEGVKDLSSAATYLRMCAAVLVGTTREPSEAAIAAADRVLCYYEMSNSGDDKEYIAEALRAAYAIDGVRAVGESPAASEADAAFMHFCDRVRDRAEGGYGEFTNADWQAACTLRAAGVRSVSPALSPETVDRIARETLAELPAGRNITYHNGVVTTVDGERIVAAVVARLSGREPASGA